MRALGPDLFIVGAPKCGTTALHSYLSEHPQIFIPHKEQHFFGSDLDEIWNRPVRLVGRPGRAKYFGEFAATGWASCRGERSVFYLWSRRAAEEIHEYNAGAKIVAMLRNPADMLASWHSQLLNTGIENIAVFEEALAAETDRRAGRRVPPHNSRRFPWRLLYRDMARFHQQLSRYFAMFEREQIHVILYDDFARDTSATYENVLRFLGVDPTFAPANLTVVNANTRIRSRNLQRLVWQMRDPSSRLRQAGTRIIPSHRVRSALLRTVPSAVRRFNSIEVPRPPLDSRVRVATGPRPVR